MPWIMQNSLSDNRALYWEMVDNDNKEVIYIEGLSMADFIPDESLWPLHFRQTTKHKNIPDFMTGTNIGMRFVSRAFRDLIEEWDPGHSAYVPIILNLADGRTLQDEYFIHCFTDFIDDGLIEDQSDIGAIIRKGRMRFYSSSANPKLTWQSEKIKGRHVWADKYLMDRFCVSDEFMQAVDDRGYALFKKIQSFAI